MLSRISLTFLAALAFTLTACTGSSGAVCSKAVECEYINPSDEAECRSDIDTAIDEGRLEQEDVDTCLDCINKNECGIDTAIDCGNKCGAVAGYVFGAQFR